MIIIHMKLFGAFRKFGESLELNVPTGATVTVVKEELKKKLNGEGLVIDSVLANDDAILKDTDIFNADIELSILPPVCGG